MKRISPTRCPGYSGHLLVATLLFLCNLTSVTCMEVRDFYSVNVLSDGEIETRIFYKGVSAKETSTGIRASNQISFRQVSNGKSLIELIYGNENHTLIDCEFGHQKHRVKSFLRTFKKELTNLVNTANLTLRVMDGKPLPSEFKWMNYSLLREKCHQRHLEIKKEMQQQTRISERQSDRALFDRSKRDLSDIFRVPGTKWCGKGYSADKYTRLGGFSKTDKCCRKHDLSCPFWIGSFETKYGLVNWRMNTLMHCSCDERFRACLKRVGTSDANLVGNLFFNVVQTKCFVLKPKKKCVRGSWWGNCEKHKMIKQAVLRDNRSF
ncbi:uncharacterized protein LOC126735783 [Anthonomus grandis grandis]|uniref:uncharacterized protein LOC126735783 n=1 Tax=Anthonomus grandis grandis TaxID=2921223 RepID=UPI00216637FD|nr:uncharacterized protein LOC126735783 [Anthonomus grandis grandis]XP_050295849.1 uncharacterized protein LOC126735783 [Anthonomus grandis grandis]